MAWYTKSTRIVFGLATIGVSAAALSRREQLIANNNISSNNNDKSNIIENVDQKLSQINFPFGTVLASWTTNHTPSPGSEWNHNWDRYNYNCSAIIFLKILYFDAISIIPYGTLW